MSPGARHPVVVAATAMVTAVALAPLGCKRDAPYRPLAATMARQHAQCRIERPTTDQNRANCRAGASWLELRGQVAEARALHERLCGMGELSSCHESLRWGAAAEAAIGPCFDDPYSELHDCHLAFTVVRPGDPRRMALFTRICERSLDRCEFLLGLELVEAPAAWQRAVSLCNEVVPDETCQALVDTPWPTPELGAGLALVARSSCAGALRTLCHAAAKRFSEDDPAHLEARRDLYTRACQLQADETCWRSDAMTERLRQRAACAAGDRAACVAVGKAVAGDGRGWRFEPTFERAAPTNASPPPSKPASPAPPAPPPAP